MEPIEKKLKSLSKYAKQIGIDNFVVLLRNGNLNTFHFENMKMSDVVNLMVAGFVHAINMEVNRHPEYSKKRKELYGELANEFSLLVKAYDQKIAAQITKEAGK